MSWYLCNTYTSTVEVVRNLETEKKKYKEEEWEETGFNEISLVYIWVPLLLVDPQRGHFKASSNAKGNFEFHFAFSIN
jgi:hypothetical protein